MANWKLVASGLAPEIPAEEAARLAAPLEKLEAEFRPLVARLRLEDEPACLVVLEPEPEA